MNSRKFINSFDRTKFLNNESMLEGCKFSEITTRKEELRMKEFLRFMTRIELPFAFHEIAR